MELTVKQAAERLQVSTKTIERRMKDGSIPFYRLGEKLIRISQTDLEAYINKNKQK